MELSGAEIIGIVAGANAVMLMLDRLFFNGLNSKIDKLVRSHEKMQERLSEHVERFHTAGG